MKSHPARLEGICTSLKSTHSKLSPASLWRRRALWGGVAMSAGALASGGTAGAGIVVVDDLHVTCTEAREKKNSVR